MSDITRLPRAMREQPRFLLRRRNDARHENKLPVSIHTNSPVGWNAPANWSTYDEATAHWIDNIERFEGLSFVLTSREDDECERIICIDGDEVLVDGKALPWFQDLIDRARSYVEISRSGRGLHLFIRVKCRPFTNLTNTKHPDGGAIEVLCNAQIAVTGNPYGEHREIATVDFSFLESVPFWRYKAKSLSADVATEYPVHTREDAERCEEAVMSLPDSVENYGGDQSLFDVACLIARFGIYGDDAMAIMRKYNDRKAHPPWTEDRLAYKLAEASKVVRAAGEWGMYSAAAVETSFSRIEDSPQSTEAELGPVIIMASSITRKTVDALWNGRLYAGRQSLLAGPQGISKSLAAADFAARVSTGRDWPDGAPCKQGQVLFISGEDDEADTTCPRLDAANADTSRIAFLKMVRKFDPKKKQTFETLFTLADVDHLDQALRKLGNCQLVVIDPVGSYMGGKTDTYRDNEVRAVLAPVAAIAEKHRCAVLLIAHHGKSESVNADGKILGSVAFSALARSTFHVMYDPRDKEKKRRLLLSGKNNLAPPQPGLGYRVVGDPPYIEWEKSLVDMDASDVLAAAAESRRNAGRPANELARAEQLLLTALRDGERPAGEVIKEAREGYGINERTLRRALDSLGGEKTHPIVGGPWFWRLGENAFREVTSSEEKSC